MIEASCCCGAVRFEVHGTPSMMGACHCSRCRKVGASTLVFVRKDQIRWIAGKDNVQRYAPEAPYTYERSFCRTCGTALGEILSDADSFPIAANVLNGDPGLRVQFHEFVAEKPDWYEICDAAKQFPGHPVST